MQKICVMKKVLLFLSTAPLLFFSCASKKELEACRLNYQTAIERNAEKDKTIAKQEVEIRSLREQIDLLKDQNVSLKQSLADCVEMGKKGSVNIEKLISEINASNAYIKQLIASKSRQDSLNRVLSERLTRSLDEQDKQDVDVRVLKGVVFISLSDKMLYRSGSYEVLPSAEKVLAKVANIINDYKDYDVLVEGHTDNVPIRTQFIKDNWDLSALRATSVVRLLQTKFGVAPERMTAGGRSEFVPKASNSTADGRSTNRRTEIIILPKLDEFMKLMEIPRK